MGIKWKIAEKQLLREKLIHERLAVEDIVIPGRNPYCIRRQALKMKLVRKLRNKRPTEAQIEELRQLGTQGLSAKQISELNALGDYRTAHSIQKILSRLELINKNRSQAAKNRKVWQNGEKEEFDDFLLQNSTALAPQQIAEIFCIKKVTVIARQKILGVKTPLVQTLALAYVREKRIESTRLRARKLLLRFKKHIAERKKKLLALAERIRQRTEPDLIEERRCNRCGENWLKHRRFFFHSRTTIDSYTCWFFSRVCVICEAKNRHQRKIEKYRQRYSQSLE